VRNARRNAPARDGHDACRAHAFIRTPVLSPLMPETSGTLRMIAIGLLIIMVFVVAIDFVNYMLGPTQDILSVALVIVLHLVVEAPLLVFLWFLLKSD